MKLFLVTTCWICKKHELRMLRYISNTGLLTHLNFKLLLCEEISHPSKHSFYIKLLVTNTGTNYWKIFYIKINDDNYINAEKWCVRFHQSSYAIWYLICFSFWFIKWVIGVWTAGLFRQISSTTKLIGWVENSVLK